MTSSSPQTTNLPPEEVFGISTVSRLTGISPHTLRIWERRYGVVDPGRTDTKRREYSREDIRRLSLIKTLVDHGHSIRHVAALPIASLESLVQESLPPSGKPVAPTRVAFAGSVSREELRSAVDSGPGLKLIGEFDSLDDLAGSLKQGAFDLLIVEIPTLFEEEARQIQQITTDMRARRAVILYRFAKRQVIAPFEQNDCGITAIRAPVNAAELRLALLADSSFAARSNLAEKSSAELSVEDFPLSDSDDFPPRQFSDAQLAKIARRSSLVQCECPQHMANLLASLSAFESYSAECENRNEEDAKLHAYLHRVTTECRADMESALQHLMEVEGIVLDE